MLTHYFTQRIIKPFLKVTFLGLVMLLSFDSKAQEGNVPDAVEYAALEAFYYALDGPNWTNNTNWLIGTTNADFGTWRGITVENGDVTKISLSYHLLTGDIPPQIGDLTSLYYLSVGSVANQNPDRVITSIPPEIGNLVNLKTLSVSNHALSSVPSEIGSLPNLEILNIMGNQVSSLPPEIGNSSNLIDINASNNVLTSIPPEIGNLTNLRGLGLAYNQISSLPDEIRQLINLKTLWLQENQLTSIPSGIGDLISLDWLNLSRNELVQLPNEIKNLVNLRKLTIYDNQLASLPSGLENLTTLRDILAYNNKLKSIPNELFTLPNLKGRVSLQDNELTFQYLEPFLTGSGTSDMDIFNYSPQDSIMTFTGVDHPDFIDETLWVADSGEHSSYQWYKNDVLIPGALNNYYTPIYDPTDPIGEYRCVITNEWLPALTIYSRPVVMNGVQRPDGPAITSSPSHSCDPASAMLIATGDTPTALINWYSSYSNSQPIATGDTLVTPVLNQNTYYYATQIVDYIESKKSGILVKIGPDYEEPRDTTLCRGAPFLVYARGPNTTITWTDLDTYDEPEFIGVIDSTKVYGYTITDGTCTAEGEIKITVLDNPEVALADSSLVACPGEELTLGVVSDSGATYLWQPGGYTTSSITITPTDEVEYTVTVTGENGCSTTETVNIPYIISRVPDREETLCVIDSTELVASPAESYLWSTGETTQSIWYKSDVPVVDDEVTVDLTRNGCTVTQHFYVTAEASCPRKPVSFSARAISTSTIQLYFREDRGTQTEYVIEKWDGSAYQYLTTLPVGTTDFQDTGLEAYTVYRYRIHAVDGANISEYGFTSARTHYPDMNYVREISLTEPGITDTTGIVLFPYGNKHTNWTYLDGLGDEIQAVIEGESPGTRDIIQTIYVDQYGRNSKQFLSYTDGSGDTPGDYRENAETEIINFYNNPPAGVAGTAYPYSEVRYDGSQRNRVVEAGSVGEEYQLGGYTTIYSYDVNHATEVIRWSAGSGVQVNGNDFYNGGLLTKSGTQDPEGLETVSYTDPTGRQIMNKQRISGASGGWAYTYYVYDDEGKLTHILPPELIERVYNEQSYPYTIGQDLLDKFAFHSEYDDNDLKIVEKGPGVEPVYFIYDDWDRLVLTQDGNQRAKNQWSFVKYDKYDRAVITGLYVNTQHTTRNAMQDHVLNYYSSGGEHFVRAGPLLGFTDESFPEGITSNDILSVSYYDEYEFLSSTPLSDTTFQLLPELNSDAGFLEIPEVFNRVKGSMTGSLIRLLGTPTFLTSVNFYDDEGRVIQSYNENHLGGLDVISSQYDFSGKIKKIHSFQSTDADTLTMLIEYDYDHGDRLKRGYHSINDQDRVYLFTNVYNELGELMSKKLHGVGSEFKQTVDYTYGVKGWLEGINKSGLHGSPDTPDPTDLFNMELIYDRNLINTSN